MKSTSEGSKRHNPMKTIQRSLSWNPSNDQGAKLSFDINKIYDGNHNGKIPSYFISSYYGGILTFETL